MFSSGRLSRLCLALCGALCLFQTAGKASPAAPVPTKPVGSLALLLPDTQDATDPRVTIWMDAIAEEGLHATIIRDSDFLQPTFDPTQYTGLIMPDQVHLTASDALIAALTQYAINGGNLLLVFDAGSLTPTGFYPVPKSRLGPLAGIDYAFYDELRDNTFGHGFVAGTEKTMGALNVPPGKFTPFQGDFTDLPMPTDPSDGKAVAVSGFQSPLFALTGYVYGYLTYPGFVTRGTYSGTPLLSSPSFGLAAGYNPVGKGGCLFVNLPLGYLKMQTDGAFLHGFLHYFATDLLQLPYLSAVPQGRGGMVMNIHLDAEPAQKPLDKLIQLGLFNQGPYSIDVTAGPDLEVPGDGLGFNLPQNTHMQQVLRSLSAKGNEIGSHGGWIHNYFGLNVSDTNAAQFEPYLPLNKNAVEAVTGKPVLEYSAPQGNMPEWITTWCQQNGILAYYFTGNTGMAPTRSYRDGELLNKTIWSVPISTYDKYASFEEFEENGISSDTATSWLVALTNFTATHRVARMVYFHPPGIIDFPDTLKAWLARAQQANGQGRFQWYTMVQLAQFLSQREQVTWSSTAQPDGTQVFQASHPVSLKNFTWVLPRAAYAQPVITKGKATVVVDYSHAKPTLKKHPGGKITTTASIPSATVSADDQEWLVTAQGGTTLEFTAKPIAP